MKKRLLLIFFISALSNIATAEQRQNDEIKALCPSPLRIPERPRVDGALDKDAVLINTDAAGLDTKKDILTLTGNVELAHDSKQLRADKIKYDQQQDIAWLYEDIHYWGTGLFLRGDAAILYFDTDTGTFEQVQYIFNEDKGWGTAQTLLSEEAGNITKLGDAHYTTCDPNDRFWEISAKKTVLNHERNQGTAWHALLWIKGLPVFYSPYLAFPIGNERKSGFLIPSYGERSYSGTELKTPYYWNIAPNMDATITPRFFFDDNNIMLTGEYRYLLKHGRGNINLEYLPDDPNASDRDHHRGLFHFKHQQHLTDHGELSLILNRVSDRAYLQDFGGNIASTSISFLESRAEVNYRGQLGDKADWDIKAYVQDFQAAGGTAPKPHTHLPKLFFRLKSQCKTHCLDYGMATEFTYFKGNKKTTDARNISALRTDLYPYLSYPIDTLAYYIRPKLGMRYTHYKLQDQGAFPDTSTRILPIFSIDSKLFLERDLVLFNNDYLQTLDFHTYYLFIPKKKQDTIPVFDTSLLGFSRTSLFSENRFSAPDRVGDANQIAVTVTSDLNHQQSGNNIGYITLGQLYHFRDRTVILPAGQLQNKMLSPLFAEIATGEINGWMMRSDIQWDPYDREIESMTSQLKYNPKPGKIAKLTYRTSPNTRQMDALFRWPINRNWSILGRWRYALKSNQSLESFAGIEYNHCCWGMRILAHRFLGGADNTLQTDLFFQVELKGLAGIGRRAAHIVKQQISDYQLEF